MSDRNCDLVENEGNKAGNKKACPDSAFLFQAG
jgi:hypothetical protein